MKRSLTKSLAIAASALIVGLTPMAASAAPGDDHRYEQRRDDRRSDRGQRWDSSRNNGYTHNGKWHYGPPPSGYDGRYQPGHRAWQRGDRVPAYYRDRAHKVDYRAHRLKAPPRGYEYVRDDNGAILLVGIATGVILSAILSQ
jgi:Ni/Co efflux regulator RcnB